MDDAGAEIEKLRREIDGIDAEIVERLNARAERARRIRELKTSLDLPVFDPDREDEILRRVAQENRGPMTAEALRQIYQSILRSMKALE